MCQRDGVTVTLLTIALAACGAERIAPTVDAPVPRQALIAELQVFQETLGIERTGNFQRFSDAQDAVYRCYYTGPLKLPPSYETLALAEGDATGCPLDEEQFDVFFYPIEAVATGSSPVSPALAAAPIERALVVVTHEDFHNQPDAQRAPFDIAEGAATLVGFLTARDFSLDRYGDTSAVFQRLDGEADRFLVKATIVNGHYERLRDLYVAYDAGALGRDEALVRKTRLYEELEASCRASEPSVSFNACPAAMNNAGLAFDRTYVRHYPTWYDLHEALGRDTGATVAAFKRLLASGPRSEAELLAAARALRTATRE
jgi:hypothetical protein